ncbi:hypothetical protein EUBVEN_01922 [Eubacterium ventriosum ATCC 27560]|uniref:Uncharacterized protein n=1 Tax=Eubacterium ventriosum ATCC 27560 TaxID=411463 RepID=A5Z882_9FIRM|nr:hypothetical protein EUBVEN_01922 [Eubacterium ventriosum ATCC 27560]
MHYNFLSHPCGRMKSLSKARSRYLQLVAVLRSRDSFRCPTF